MEPEAKWIFGCVFLMLVLVAGLVLMFQGCAATYWQWDMK